MRDGAITDRAIISDGYYQNLPFETYLSEVRRLSSSGLKLLAKSPLHLVGSDEKKSESLNLGSACHCRLLTTEKFDGAFAVSPQFDRRTKDGKAGYEQFTRENSGKSIISIDDYNLITEIEKAIRQNKTASYYLSLPGASELSVFWSDNKYGFGCKARPDRLVFPDHTCCFGGAILDLKTTRDASPAGFMSEIRKYRYHWQAAWYIGGVSQALNYRFDRFIFIAVEKEKPYGVGVYELDADSIESARHDIAGLRKRYAECLQSGEWKGYADDVITLRLPKYAMNNNYFGGYYAESETEN